MHLGPRRFKVVVDAGNGAGGLTAVAAAAKRSGFDVEPLYCEPGRAASRTTTPTPRVPENLADLIARVRATGAEVGIALDGDADRIGAVDGQGRILWGDQLLILFARDILTAQAGRHVRQRGEVLPGDVRRDREARAARPSCGRSATR